MSRTRYEWTLIDYAIWAAGAVTVPVYETSSAYEVEWILSDSGARAAFAETEQALRDDRGRPRNAPALEQVWLIDGDRRPGPGPGRRRRHRRAARAAPDGEEGGGPGDDRLHVGHHGPPEGLRDHPREPAVRRPQRHPGRAHRDLRRRRQLDPAVLAARARVCPHHPGRLPGVRGHPRALAGHGHGGQGAPRVPAHLPARRAAGIREGLQQRAAAGRGQQGEEPDLQAAVETAVAWSKSQAAGGIGRRRSGPGSPAAPRAVRPPGLRASSGRRSADG